MDIIKEISKIAEMQIKEHRCDLEYGEAICCMLHCLTDKPHAYIDEYSILTIYSEWYNGFKCTEEAYYSWPITPSAFFIEDAIIWGLEGFTQTYIGKKCHATVHVVITDSESTLETLYISEEISVISQREEPMQFLS